MTKQGFGSAFFIGLLVIKLNKKAGDVMKFTGISIISEDVRRLAKFYAEVLRVEADDNDIHSFVKVPGAELTIYSKAAAEQDMGFSFANYWGSGNFAIEFAVDDVDEEYERLKTMGVEFVALPTTHPWGNRAMQFRDLDGNIVTFACPCK